MWSPGQGRYYNRRVRPLVPTVSAAAIGIAVAIGGYTFIYAHGGSYLTNNPQACANCHVMEEQYRGWLKGSHRSVAVCNDCT